MGPLKTGFFKVPFSDFGSRSRQAVWEASESLFRNPRVHIRPQTHDSFRAGVGRYHRRPDKSYSLTDCISMNEMDALHIRRILTSDRHFEQEGYEILLKT